MQPSRRLIASAAHRMGLGAVLALTLFAAAPAVAGEEEDRVREIEDTLSRMKDNLNGLVSASSSSGVDEAIRNASRVKEAADKLRSINAQNEPGKTMANNYASYVDRFTESARYLRDLKDAQIKQENERLWDRCGEADQKLRDQARNYLDRKDKPEGQKGLTALPEEAERVGRPLGEQLKAMQEISREQERRRSSARNFSESNGRWSDVKDRLHGGAEEVYGRWSTRMTEIQQKCGEVVKGKDSFLVTDTIAKLGSHAADLNGRYSELRRRFFDWRRDLNSFRQGALQDAREIKELFCNDLDWERRVQQIADKNATDLRGKWDRLTSERDDMLNKADQLISAGSSSAPKLKRLIIQAWDKVEPIKDGELKGANHPMIRATIEKGKAEHKSRQGSCHMKETSISSPPCNNPHPLRNSCRLDCVRTCTIVEIKPNNAAEIAMGGNQVLAYKKAFDEMWKKDGAQRGPESEMFTANSGAYSHLKSCVSGSPGSYSFRTEMFVETYAFCPADPAVFFGNRDPIPTEDPPEKAND